MPGSTALAERNDALEDDVNGAIPCRLVDLERIVALGDRGVGDEDRDGTEDGQRLPRRRPPGGEIGDVIRGGDRPAARVHDLAGDARRGVLVPVENGDGGTLGGEAEGVARRSRIRPR